MLNSSTNLPLIVLDLANNHNGSVDHGKRIIKMIAEVTSGYNFRVAVKFQYRDLDTFIHQDFKGNKSYSYIKRFEETRLSERDFQELISVAKKYNLITACTPFDEVSVDKMEREGFDILKIASASFSDWPLLNRISLTKLPVIASTAGADLNTIDKVVSFLTKRVNELAIMHCVASYPTPDSELKLNRIDVLVQRYSPLPIGYSTHENPKNTIAVKLALAKGAKILERHVGSAHSNNAVNLYSSDETELRAWLDAIVDSLPMMSYSAGVSDTSITEQKALLGLRRGVYAKQDLKINETISSDKVYFAVPLQDGQLSANDFSDYVRVYSNKEISSNKPLFISELSFDNQQFRSKTIADQTRSLLSDAKYIIPTNINLEISHHYGLDKFEEFGMVMFTLVNREYCKKVLVLAPGQTNPEHFHKVKEETFFCIYGELELIIEGESKLLKPGMSCLVPVGQKHLIRSRTGALAEEISTRSYSEDSYYTDIDISNNPNRKTNLTLWH